MTTNLNPRMIEVSISGKVENRGIYTLSKVAINDAIAFAGGKSPISRKITLGRINGDGSVIKKNIKYKKTSKKEANLIYLMQGDIVHVGSSIYSKTASVISELTAPISGIVNTYYYI